MDQPQVESAIAGVKLGSIVLAACGSAISLSYIQNLSRRQAVISFVSGLITSVAVTPLALHYLGLPSALEGGIAFLAGLGAMAAIPAAIAFVDRLRNAKIPFLPDDKGTP